MKKIYDAKIAIVAVMTIATLLGGCKKNKAPVAMNNAPAQVQVAKPVAKSVEFWDDYTARLDALAFVELRARVGGYLQKVCFKEGQSVNKGDLLFVIDPRPYEAALAAAKAQVKEVEARLALATSNNNRLNTILLFCYSDRENQIARANIVDNILTLDNLTKASVNTVKMLSILTIMADKKL